MFETCDPGHGSGVVRADATPARAGEERPDDFDVSLAADLGFDLAFDRGQDLVFRFAASLGDRHAFVAGIHTGR